MTDKLCVSVSCVSHKQSILYFCSYQSLFPAALSLAVYANERSALQPFQFNKLYTAVPACVCLTGPPVNHG